jgi:hypothetical protein
MDGLDRTMPAWLGEEPTKRLREHLKTVDQVSVETIRYLAEADSCEQGDGWKIE